MSELVGFVKNLRFSTFYDEKRLPGVLCSTKLHFSPQWSAERSIVVVLSNLKINFLYQMLILNIAIHVSYQTKRL